MALTVPRADDLAVYLREDCIEDTGYTEEWADEALQYATDLMEIGADLSEDPDSSTVGYRIMRRGILSMAQYLLVNFDDREALFSPFSSERMGSYSYSKLQQAAKEHSETPVPEFDVAVNYFTSLNDDGGGLFAVSSTNVMEGIDNPLKDPEPTLPYYYSPAPIRHQG